MFWEATGLTTLDLRNFDMTNVNNISGMFDGSSSNLTTIDISNWVLKPDVIVSEITGQNLQYIKCNDNSTINILIPILPDRTGKDAGKILVSNTDGLDTTAMTAKNWTAVTIEQCITIAEYRYDESIWNNFIPTFNDDFNGYFVIDNYVDTQNMNILDRTFYANNIVTRKIISIENKPSLIRFGNVMDGPAELYTRAQSLLSVDSLDISNLTTTDSLFRKCTYLKSINTENWDTSEITNMYCMFADCQALTALDVSHFNTGKVWLLTHAFTCCTSLKTIDVSNWDVSKVTRAQYMFNWCSNLTSLNLSNWDVRSISDFNGAFEGCTNLTTIGDTSGWNTASLVSTSNMFKNCSSLTSINLSNWNMSKVTSTESMFNKCTNLTTIGDTSGWLTYALTSMDYMFERCEKLQSIDVSNWYTANVTKMIMVFFNCR
jgi:surface protein